MMFSISKNRIALKKMSGSLIFLTAFYLQSFFVGRFAAHTKNKKNSAFASYVLDFHINYLWREDSVALKKKLKCFENQWGKVS